MPSPTSPFHPTLTDRIDACSVLTGATRERASLALYCELTALTDSRHVTALEWRHMGVELGVCRLRHDVTGNAHEFLRARAVDCHNRADVARRIEDLALDLPGRLDATSAAWPSMETGEALS